jgi:hypothetical protein
MAIYPTLVPNHRHEIEMHAWDSNDGGCSIWLGRTPNRKERNVKQSLSALIRANMLWSNIDHAPFQAGKVADKILSRRFDK